MKNKLLTTLLIGVSIMLVGCTSKSIGSREELDQPITADQRQETDKTQLPKSQADRDQSASKETKLGAGTFYVGQDIPIGRYVCTGSGDGNLSIYDGEVLTVNEIIDATNQVGVASVTIDLYEGQKIEVSELNELVLTPAKTLVRTTLTTGNWIVGLDIQPGSYFCEPVIDGMLEGKGNLVVYDKEIQVAHELLDANGELGAKNVIIELEEGQSINISGLPEVKFTEK